uniref:Protein containing Myb5 and GT1 domain n=1 Tax=Rhipicephalus zambeziensis TaxID=60191 RepID=A0A224Y4B2_9ACAR
MEMLLEFVNEHPYLVNGSKDKTKEVEPWEREQLWEEAAAKLNAKGPAVKTRYAWRKFWSGRAVQIRRTVARVAKMREESKMPPRPPPPPPQPQRPEAGQILLLVKQDGSAASPGRLLLPRPVPQPPPQQQVLLHVGDPTTMFMATDCPTMPTTAVPAEVATTRGATLQQSVVGSGGMLLEQPASAEATHHQGPPVLQQRHVLANGQPPPDPDSIPVLEPITAEEHFHAEMLHQTIKQTALLQDMLSAQQRMAEAAERQAQAAEEQSHALSQLVLFLIENHRSNRNSSANLSSSVADDCSCPEAATPLSITPEILQVEHST